MLNSAEHKILSANKYENANNSWHFHIYKQRKFHSLLAFSYLLAEKFSCSAMFSKKKIAIVSNLRFISMKNFMLSWALKKSLGRFITVFPKWTLLSLNLDINVHYHKTRCQSEINTERQTVSILMREFVTSHLDLHQLHRYLVWSAGLKGLIISVGC